MRGRGAAETLPSLVRTKSRWVRSPSPGERTKRSCFALAGKIRKKRTILFKNDGKRAKPSEKS